MRFRTAAVVALAIAACAILRWDARSLPFFWDEIGYYVPFAFTFFENNFAFEPHWMTPVSYHTPGFYLTIAALAKITGWGLLPVRLGGYAAAGGLLSGQYALARRFCGPWPAAASALALMTAPVFLSEAGMAHPDMPMAAFATWSLAMLLANQTIAASVLLCLSVACNATVLVLVPVYAWCCRGRVHARRDFAILILPSFVVLGAWAAFVLPFQLERKAEVLGGLSYNTNLSTDLFAMAKRLAYRGAQVFFADGRWLLTLAVATGLRQWVRNRSPTVLALAGVLAIETAFLGVFGATHQRYFLIALPPLYTLAFAALAERRRGAVAAGFLGAVVLVVQVTTWFGPVNKLASDEYRVAYIDEVRQMQIQANRLAALPPGGPRIVGHWPLTDALSRPFLGFVTKPVPIIDMGDAPIDKLRTEMQGPPASFQVEFSNVDENLRGYMRNRLSEAMGRKIDFQCQVERLGAAKTETCALVTP